MTNIIITAVSQDYYNACLTLIASIHRTSLDIVDKIIVYDINLSHESISYLNTLKLVQVINLREVAGIFFPGWLIPKQHAYKGYCLVDASKYGDHILWIDSGAMLLKSCIDIFNKIKRSHVFCVEDNDPNLNLTWTHKQARRILKTTPKELGTIQLCSGIFGYKHNGRFQKMIDEAYKYFNIKGCIHGDHSIHRHDQCILSILTIRYNCPRNLMTIYAEWRDYNKCVEDGNVVIFVHRRHIHNITGLIHKLTI